MFRNLGKGQFDKVSDSLGPDFMRPIPSRGLATSDYDNDTDVDIVTENRGDYPSLLRNDGGNAKHWLGSLLVGAKSNRDGIGASLKLTAGASPASNRSKAVCVTSPRTIRAFTLAWGSAPKSTRWKLLGSAAKSTVSTMRLDKIIAVKEGTGIVPRNFPQIAPHVTAPSQPAPKPANK